MNYQYKNLIKRNSMRYLKLNNSNNNQQKFNIRIQINRTNQKPNNNYH